MTVVALAAALVPRAGTAAPGAPHGVRCQRVVYAGADHASACGSLTIDTVTFGSLVKATLRYVPADRSTMPAIALSVGRIESRGDAGLVMAVQTMGTDVQGTRHLSDARGECRVAALDSREPTMSCEAEGDATVGAVRFDVSLAAPVAGGSTGAGPTRQSLAFTRDWRDAQTALSGRPAVPQVVAKAPGPVSTLFGIPVGARLPQAPGIDCTDRAAAAPAKWCRDVDPDRTAAAIERLRGARAAFDEHGYRLLSVQLNDGLTDTGLLRGPLDHSRPIDVVLDAAGVVQSISVFTPALEHERLLAMLSAKYGKPMRVGPGGVSAAGSGDRVAVPTIYDWDFANVSIEYRSEVDESPRVRGGGVGRIDVYLPSYAEFHAKTARPP